MQHDTQKLAYTIKQFMTLAGVGHSFTYEEIASGRLRAVKAGRKTLIREDDARAWLAALPSMESKSKQAFQRRRNTPKAVRELIVRLSDAASPRSVEAPSALQGQGEGS